MSTTITALPQRSIRPFLAGAMTALLMAGLVIGIALAIDLGRTRTVQTASEKAPVVVNDRDYAAGRGQLPQAHVGGAKAVTGTVGSSDPAYQDLRARDAANSLTGTSGSSDPAYRDLRARDAAGSKTFSPANGPIPGYGSGSATNRSSDNFKLEHGR